jgi:haloacid dehalogenase-like hydrolase
VTSNGAVGYHPGGRDTFWSRRTRVYDSLKQLASDVPDLVVTADVDTGVYASSRLLNRRAFPGKQRLASWPELLTLSCARIFVRTTSLPVTALADKLTSAGYGVDAYEADGAVWADVMHPSASKSSALEALRVGWGMATQDTMAIGDSWNDIDMITWAGTGVAMGDAPDEVVAAADLQLSGCDDDGVGGFLSHMLQRPPL